MSKRGNTPIGPTGQQYKDLRALIKKQEDGIETPLTDIAVLKADNDHNKLHIKALAALIITIMAGFVFIYFQMTAYSDRATDKLEKRLERLEDKLDSSLNNLREQAAQKPINPSYANPASEQSNNSK